MSGRILCSLDELAEGEPRGFSLAGELPLELILLRRGGQVLAYRNRCPHTGINLEWLPDQFLDHSGRYLQCATHGALFRPEDGYCLRGPCAGYALEALPVVVKEGQVVLEE
ncbi:MAG: Rieske (2Fe-2S) protein [Gammaproteobacteria bacterium]|nr:MAG: Rieske (2Fe-2S) protein [Gammaproteobacteria bacterium]